MDRERGAKERVAFEYARNMADRYAPVREAVRDALAAHGADAKEADRAALASAASPYHAKRVQGGHAERDMARARAIEADLARDVAALGRLGLSVDDLGVWAYASHAKARNAQKRRESGAENGSGISDALADDILSGRGFSLGDGAARRYSPEQARALEAARRRIVGRLNDEFGLDYLHRAGLVDEATRGRLERAYGKDWVSLADDISEDGVDYNSAATVANPLKRARGRATALEDNPVVTTVLGAMRNVVNAKRNMAAETLARFVEAHPEMGEVRPMRPTDRADDASVVLRRNVRDPATGEERNVKLLVVLRGRRGAEVARAFNDADVVRGPGWMQGVTRRWAAFATQLSPTFSARNFLKDTVEVTLDTLGTQGLGAAGRFLRDQAATMPLWNREFRETLREWRETGRVTGDGELARDFRRFVESGALIGGGGAREGYGEMLPRLRDVTRDLGRAGNARRRAAVLWDAYVRKIGAVNEAIETLTRFNNFRNRIRAGETDAEAAINSREGSTDFGMYGNQRWMNSVWMFSNSILGGTMRAAKTMTLGKYGRRLAVGMVAAGFLEEMADAALNGDDDERAKRGEPTGDDVPEHERMNSFRLRLGGKSIRVPTHLGPWTVLKYAGNNAYRAMAGKISWERAAENVASAAATVATHFGGTGEHSFGKGSPSLVNSLAPSAVVQPLVQVALNEDYKGDRIHREHSMGSAKYAPDFKYAKRGTNRAWVEISRALNNLPLGGGSDLVKGRYSIPPEDIEYLAKQIFKNFGTDAVNALVETPRAALETAATGENAFELRNVPFARDVVRDVPDVSAAYYEAKERHAEERQALRAAKGAERVAYLRAHPSAARDLKKAEERVRRLAAAVRGEVLDKDGKVVRTFEPTAERVEKLRAALRREMARYVTLAGGRR